MNTIELLSPELVRLAFVFGMVLSVVSYERSHLTTGSIVVPGFLGIHIFEPIVILVSILNAWVCYCLIHRVLARFWLLSATAKFHSLIVTSVVLQVVLTWIASLHLELAMAAESLLGFGYIIPGLIAHDMARNGSLKTGLHALTASFLVGGLVMLMTRFSPELSLIPPTATTNQLSAGLPMLLLLSALGSIALKLKTTVRSGGYITAAYVVFFGVQPFVVVLIVIIASINHLMCTRLLMPGMIVFGRRKFALMLITGSILMWSACLLATCLGAELDWFKNPKYAGIIVLLPGLIANDMQRTSVSSVTLGLGLITSWIVVVANLIHEIQFYSRPEYVLPLVACLGGIWLLIVNYRKRQAVTVQLNPVLANAS